MLASAPDNQKKAAGRVISLNHAPMKRPSFDTRNNRPPNLACPGGLWEGQSGSIAQGHSPSTALTAGRPICTASSAREAFTTRWLSARLRYKRTSPLDGDPSLILERQAGKASNKRAVFSPTPTRHWLQL
jgi:hypothetical protein